MCVLKFVLLCVLKYARRRRRRRNTRRGGTDTPFPCFTSTKVQILAAQKRRASRGEALPEAHEAHVLLRVLKWALDVLKQALDVLK
jgi:hypothetical protein